MAASTSKPTCKHLVLDAGPLLSLSPLRGLAETYYTVPQVLDELKDKRAREHFERLGLSAGVNVQVKSPDAVSLTHVIQFAKKTGDYSVLSHADLSILALTYALDRREKLAEETAQKDSQNAGPSTAVAQPSQDQAETSADTPHENTDSVVEAETSVPEREEITESVDENERVKETANDEELDGGINLEPLEVEIQRIEDDTIVSPLQQKSIPQLSQPTTLTPDTDESQPIYDDPSESDDGEGEWITPSNVGLHKSRALDLLPSAAGPRRGKQEVVPVACMTADFAMQNVLLQMGLGLMGVEGRRIERVKSWVLRCHACFKICKDMSRKFCPSCGNPSLLRASVTISSPTAGADTPTLEVHLKKNFQFRTRGTKYSIPAPKPGSAKTGPGEGLILREDQTAWLRAKKHADGKRDREERRLLNAAAQSDGKVVSSWMDPDWMPEMLSVGAGGKGRSMRSAGMDGDMPVIGHGRKNPNERRRRK